MASVAGIPYEMSFNYDLNGETIKHEDDPVWHGCTKLVDLTEDDEEMEDVEYESKLYPCSLYKYQDLNGKRCCEQFMKEEDFPIKKPKNDITEKFYCSINCYNKVVYMGAMRYKTTPVVFSNKRRLSADWQSRCNVDYIMKKRKINNH